MAEHPDDRSPDEAGRDESKHERVELEMLRKLLKMCERGESSEAFQHLSMILGCGPAFAAFESLIAANRADGLMYYNAVSNQQKTNLISMAVTAKCVKYMLNPTPGPDDNDLLDEAVEEALGDE